MHPVGSYCTDISQCTVNRTLNFIADFIKIRPSVLERQNMRLLLYIYIYIYIYIRLYQNPIISSWGTKYAFILIYIYIYIYIADFIKSDHQFLRDKICVYYYYYIYIRLYQNPIISSWEIKYAFILIYIYVYIYI